MVIGRSFFVFFVAFVSMSVISLHPLWAQDSPSAEPCEEVLVRAFDKDYCLEDYVYSETTKYVIADQAYSQGEDPEQFLRSAPYRALFNRIWLDSIEHRLTQYNLQVTQKELDLFESSYFDIQYAEIHGLELKMEAIEELLRNRKFDQSKRRQIRTIRAALRKEIKNKRAHQLQQALEGEKKERFKSTLQSSGFSIIQDWKIHNALFRIDGGRAARIGKIMEPVDAILKQYTYIQDTGNLEIFDKKYQKAYDARVQRLQDFLKSEDLVVSKAEDITAYYRVPFWVNDAVDARKPYVEQLIAFYKEVGFTGNVQATVQRIVLTTQRNNP